MEQIDDYEWAQAQLIWEVGFMGAAGGAWEYYLYDQMIKENGKDRPTWQARSEGRRAIIVSHMIDYLVGDKRIEAIPGKTQATGRRRFRLVNILDTIVAALESDEGDT